MSSTSQNKSIDQRTLTGAEQCPSDWLGINCATDTGRETQTDGSSCVDRICGGTFTSLSGSTSHAPVYSKFSFATNEVHCIHLKFIYPIIISFYRF